MVTAVAKNNVLLAIRDTEFAKPTVTAVFSVIPAKAGIQVILIFPGPRIGVRGDGLIPANRIKILAIAINIDLGAVGNA
jgi:hypothetical protein